MPDIAVDAVVAQGSLNQVFQSTSIGTDGCTMCVGMVAVMPDNSVWCAHFDCSLSGRTEAEQQTIQADTFSMLTNALKVQPVKLVACTTSTLRYSTGAIWAGIRQFDSTAEIRDANGLYATSQREINTVKGSSCVTGPEATKNDYASIPMQVGAT